MVNLILKKNLLKKLKILLKIQMTMQDSKMDEKLGGMTKVKRSLFMIPKIQIKEQHLGRI